MAGGGTNTVQKADPWSGIQPFLVNQPGSNINGLINTAYNQFMGGGNPQYYPGSTYAGVGDYTHTIQNQIIGRAQGPDSLEQQARDFYSKAASGGSDIPLLGMDPTASGSYLNSNPYLKAMMDAASSDVTRQFNTATMPSIASQFSLGGRYGSGAQTQGISDATNNLAGKLTGMASNLYGQNYANERQLMENSIGRTHSINMATRQLNQNLQLQAANALPKFGEMDYSRWQRGLAAAQMQDQERQMARDADVARWDFNQNAPWMNLGRYSNLLQGFGGMGSSTSSRSSSQGSPVSNALGGAMLANSLYGLGANAGLWGGAAGLGAMGSMGLGAGALMGAGGYGLAGTGALAGVSAGANLFSTAAPLMALAL